MKVYLASPYGFTRAGLEYLPAVRAIAENEWGVDLLDPWDAKTFDYGWALETSGDPREAEAWKSVAGIASAKNFGMISKSDVVVAVLDGTDVDSGVACEIGYAYGIGIPILGYRSDFRRTGDSMHGTVNLQVESCLRGAVCTDWKQVEKRLNKMGLGTARRRKRRHANDT